MDAKDYNRRAILKCSACFLGSAIPVKSSESHEIVNEPLKEILSQYKKYGEERVRQVQLYVFHSGIFITVHYGKFEGRKVWYPIQNLYCSAGLLPVQQKDHILLKELDDKSVVMRLELKDKSISKLPRKYNPIFAIVVREVVQRKLLRCYAFTVERKQIAKLLVSATKAAYMDRSGWNHPVHDKLFVNARLGFMLDIEEDESEDGDDELYDSLQEITENYEESTYYPQFEVEKALRAPDMLQQSLENLATQAVVQTVRQRPTSAPIIQVPRVYYAPQVVAPTPHYIRGPSASGSFLERQRTAAAKRRHREPNALHYSVVPASSPHSLHRHLPSQDLYVPPFTQTSQPLVVVPRQSKRKMRHLLAPGKPHGTRVLASSEPPAAVESMADGTSLILEWEKVMNGRSPNRTNRTLDKTSQHRVAPNHSQSVTAEWKSKVGGDVHIVEWDKLENGSFVNQATSPKEPSHRLHGEPRGDEYSTVKKVHDVDPNIVEWYNVANGTTTKKPEQRNSNKHSTASPARGGDTSIVEWDRVANGSSDWKTGPLKKSSLHPNGNGYLVEGNRAGQKKWNLFGGRPEAQH